MARRLNAYREDSHSSNGTKPDRKTLGENIYPVLYVKTNSIQSMFFFFWCVCILVFEKWSHYTVQVYEELVIKMTLGLNCRDPPTFASQGLRLKVNSTILSFNQTLF